MSPGGKQTTALACLKCFFNRDGLEKPVMTGGPPPAELQLEKWQDATLEIPRHRPKPQALFKLSDWLHSRSS